MRVHLRIARTRYRANLSPLRGCDFGMPPIPLACTRGIYIFYALDPKGVPRWRAMR